MQNTSSYVGLDHQYQVLKALVENPKFQKIISEIHKLPPIERLEAAFTRLTPEALEKSDVPVPKGLSMSATATENATEGFSTSATATENTTSGANPVIELKWCLFPWAYGAPSPTLQPQLFVPSVSISMLLASNQ